MTLQQECPGFEHREACGSQFRGCELVWASPPVDQGRIWQPRFYDFVVFSEHKRVEKLRYMHRNPVKRGLVLEPKQWCWSSSRHYAYGEAGLVVVNEPQKAELRIRKIS
jgi:hypothetical protein